MAFQSEVAPPVVGEANKDTIDGETKSDENDTEEEEDLEEGEILDSGDETEQEVPKSVEEKSPDTKTPAKPASDPQQQQQSSSEEKKHKRWNKNPDVSRSSRHSGRKSKRPKPEQESDHEESDYEDEEDDYDGDESKESWYHRPSKKHVGSDDGIIDYARELAAYRDSSDHNSPERRTDKKRERSSRKKLKSSSSHKSRSKKDSPSPSPSKRTLKRKILLDKKGKYKKGVITGRKLCKYFQEGTCAKGSDCPFIHPFPKKQELCRYYISGHCSKRKHCPYMHEEFPCKFFHTGAKCYAGDNCRYSHEPLTEETGRLLKEYLKSNSHDDHRDRGKKRRSKTPDPPQKRKCLLGSPPRHLKEAEETKHWQDEMMRLQQEKGTDAFQIHLSPSHDSSPNPYLQPDDYEYGDTMQSPPRPAMPRDGPEVGSPPHHMQPNFMPISPNHQGHPNFASSGSSAPVQQNFVSSAPPTAQMPPSFASARPPLLQLPPNFVATSTAQPQPPAPQNFGPMGPALHLQQAFMPMGPPVSQPLQPPFASMVPPLQAQAPQNQAVQDQNMKLNLDWNNIRALVDMMSAKQEEKGGTPATEGEVEQQKLETISSEKEPAQNSTSSVENTSKTALKEAAQKDWEDEKNIDSSGPNDGEAVSESSRSTAEPSTSVSQSPAHVSEAPEPIVIPSHLPRKQRELLLRIQKHQKLKSADSDDTSDGMERSESESQTFGDDKQLTRSESADLCGGEEEMETKADIYSSDDDDDDDDADKPLTDVLKKLQETPPPKPKEVPPKPKIDINQMLSTIMQKAKENCPSKAMCEKQNEFWQNILLGGTPQAKASSQGSSVVDNTKNSLSQDLSTKPPEKNAPAVRDPRLKNRENRVPPVNTAPLTSSPMPPIHLLETKGMANHHRDISTAPSQTSAVVVDGLTANVPYKLHNVSTKPLNYAPYIQASLSDPKLLNDPRLRKRLQNATADATHAGSENSEDMTKPGKLPELPLFSQHKMQKCEGFGVPLHENNISSSASSPPAASTRPTLPDIKLPPLQNQPQPTPRVSDPRRRPDQRHPPGGNTPPQPFPATGPEAVRPEVPQAALPPRTSAATPSSHLPRAICDPRMAKLHHPLDPRRPRAAPESVNKGSVASNSLQRGKHQTPPQESQGDNRATAAAAAPKSDPANAEADPEQEKGEQKGKVAANEKVRNKDVLRNRKSSMEYASPLNSCDEANSSGGLKYNSYNQRPKKNLPPLLAEGNAPKEMLPPASAVISALTLEAAADEAVPSTDCGENIVPSASLKDMFKTIDPTASPFC